MPTPKLPPISADSFQKMIQTLENFVDKSAVIVNKYQNQPTANSQAFAEINSFPVPELVEDAYSRGIICFESAADHFMAFTVTLKPPAKTLSPYTCVRSLMESSAITLWLFDLNIDARERVGRCFGYRYKEFEEQKKFFNSDKVRPADAQQAVNDIKQRMAVVEAKAITLGYPKLWKHGNTTGIGVHMPETIPLIRKTLDKEQEYRLLSGVAHSYLWATRQVGFQVIEAVDIRGRNIKALEKHIHSEMIFHGLNIAVPTLARVFWTIGKQYGWDMEEIEGLLNQVFDQIGFNNNQRFWRHS